MAAGQTLFLGPSAGYGISKVEEGNGSTFHIGISTDLNFTRDKIDFLYLTGKLSYSSTDLTLQPPVDSLSVVQMNFNNATTYNLADYATISSTLGLGVSIESFSLDASIVADKMLNGNFKQLMVLNSSLDTPITDTTLFPPGEVQSEIYNGKFAIVTGKADLTDLNSWLWGVQLCLKYSFNIDPIQIQIAPVYRYYWTEFAPLALSMNTFMVDFRVGYVF